MDTWIDCMTSLDAPDDGLSSVHVGPGDMLMLCISGAGDLKKNCPEIYYAFVECSAFVNYRRISGNRGTERQQNDDRQSSHFNDLRARFAALLQGHQIWKCSDWGRKEIKKASRRRLAFAKLDYVGTQPRRGPWSRRGPRSGARSRGPRSRPPPWPPRSP